MRVKLLLAGIAINICFSSCTSWRASGRVSIPTTPPTSTSIIGQRVKVLSIGQWTDATIMNVGTGNQYFIHYDGWSTTVDEWVTSDRVQFNKTMYYVGQQVQVLQNNIWYGAHIMQISNNQYYIKYNNFTDYEWVTSNRIRFR